MKPSLEEERRALLEQIEASRAVYRRMLAGEPTSGPARPLMQTQAAGPGTRAFPRSQTVQWVMAHPLWVAGGVALLVLLAPRAIGRSKRAAAQRKSARRAQPATGGGTLRALVTVAALLLRDPTRMRAAAAFASRAWHWLQRRRRPAAIAPMSAIMPRTAASAPDAASARPAAHLH